MITQILENDGPMISGQLLDKMESQFGISRQAARQRLSRSASPVHRLGGFFKANQSFVYLEHTYKTNIWYESLIETFKTDAKRYYSVVKAIEYHHGFLENTQLHEFTFSPVVNLKGHKRIDKIIQELVEIGLIYLNSDHQYTFAHDYSDFPININRHKGATLAKKVVLDQFDDWAKKINLTSFNTGKFHSEFGKFQWGYTSPSYILPLRKITSKGKLQHGFVLGDALIGNMTKLDEVTFFIEKVEILKKQRGLFPFVPFLLVEILDKETLEILRQKGIVVGFIDKLFGSGYAELIRSLIQTVENAGAILKKNPEKFLDLMTNLSKLVDGKTANLRGDLFELVVGYYHGQLCKSLDIGKRILHDGRQRELDVLASYEGELRIVECKGNISPFERGKVHEWLTDKIPVIRKWALDQEPYRKKKIIFELWSTGGFEEDAIELIENYKKNHVKFNIEYFGFNEIMKKAAELESQKFKEIMEQYYMKPKKDAIVF